MDVERTVEPSEVDWDFYETCENPYDVMDRNRLLEDRVDALEAIRAYCHEVARGVDRSEITKDLYAAYEHACTLLGIHTEEASEREAREGRQEAYTERYKGYTLTCEPVTDPLPPDAFFADDEVFLSAAHLALMMSPDKTGDW
jgi:hypothetical protein